MSAPATRLECLFLLVRDGSCAQIRENAAEKLGEVASSSPDVCASILQQLRPLIVDVNWDIRVAASKCLDVVARSLQKAKENVAEHFALVSFGINQNSCSALSLQTVDIEMVVKEGAPLLRSGGEEYHYKTNLTEQERRCYAVKQRRLLLRRLSGADGPIWNTREDSLTQIILPRLNWDHAHEIATDIEASETAPIMTEEPGTIMHLKSAQEILPALQKRKHDLLCRTTERCAFKRSKSERVGETTVDPIMSSKGEEVMGERVIELKLQSKIAIVAGLVSDLFDCMFDSKWETRHGALLSLRQILLSAQFVAAVEAVRSIVDNHGSREIVDRWLEESLIRCICVLALDQFVDYSADGSVSPVREVCAQVFGILLGSLSNEMTLARYLQVVRNLFSTSMWHACHGGLLGLKYLIQAHKKHAQVLIPLVYSDMLSAFTSFDSEEVLVLAADMLGSFVSFVNNVKDEEIAHAALLLWNSVEIYKKNGLIMTSIIHALSAWHSHSRIAKLLQNNSDVQEAIWQNIMYTVPMLHHHSQTVRASCATCVAAIFSGQIFSLQSSLSTFVQHFLLQILFEKDKSVQQSLLSTWKQIIFSLLKEDLFMHVVGNYLPRWTSMLWSFDEIDNLQFKLANSAISSDNELSAEFSPSANRGKPENLSSRVLFAEAAAFAFAHVPLVSSCMKELLESIRNGLDSESGERQCAVLLALSKWSYYEKQLNDKNLQKQSRRIQYLQDSIGSFLKRFADNHWRTAQPNVENQKWSVLYTEQLGSLNRVLQMEARVIDIFSSEGIKLQATHRPDSLSAADTSRKIAENVAQFPYELLQDRPKVFEIAHFKRQDLFVLDEFVQQSFCRLHYRIKGLGSCAYCEVLPFPQKCGILVKSLMNSLMREEDKAIQAILAESIAQFVVSQAHIQKKCVAKIINNLCHSATALVGVSGDYNDIQNEDNIVQNDQSRRIPHSLLKPTQVRVVGAEAVLKKICNQYGNILFQKCRALEAAVSKAWEQQGIDELTIKRCMHLISFLVPHFDSSPMTTCLSWLIPLAKIIQQPRLAHQTRSSVAHGIASICKHAKSNQHRSNAMLVIYNSVFEAFRNNGDASSNFESLMSAVMVLDRIVHTLGVEIAPYLPSLVHYAMKTMSSQSKIVRMYAAETFANFIPLIPLEMDIDLRDANKHLSDSLRKIVEENAVSRSFLESFTAGKAVQHTDVRTWLSSDTSLRTYQQHGVDWLCFMAKNQLHGILADDMGLGKTLQTLSAMAATIGSTPNALMPCIVVCPPIIVHHWIQEVEKHIPGVFAAIIDYSVPISDRRNLQCRSGTWLVRNGLTLIITTYSILRTDIEFLKTIDFAYSVLDEAHLIRNPNTGIFRAVLEIRASRRIALSGTPLQNNVTDLWALFEFLMPGYLGDFTKFRREFVLPITKSKERNATTKQKENAAIAITKLHQKMLPFILRRTKDQVLKELPPKIISNVLLPLSSLQQKLYSLASSPQNESKGSMPTLSKESTLHETKRDKIALTSVLIKLQVLRKICVHPALVVDNDIIQSLSSNEKAALLDWKCSGKMTGLHDILVECFDISARNQASTLAIGADDANISPHRCLVFAHLHKTLDLTEKMLEDALPGVRFCRIDGKTTHAKRLHIVQKFNTDPSIDILLLTTSVGGLGLTLTGADTVIFIEHSWNPFVDLQAMDRAHRIGQTRTVRVFRLIMENSLEEHIVHLQDYKEQVASTVVQKSDVKNSTNINTKEVLNLLRASSSIVAAKGSRKSAQKYRKTGKHLKAVLPKVAKNILDQIGELWDESQYKCLAFPESNHI